MVEDYLDYLASEGKSLGSVYGLLSKTGGHPHIAKDDQAQLLRGLVRILARFAMLRYRKLKDEPCPGG